MENLTNQEVFKTLNGLNFNENTKEKLGLKYLSWAYAWEELMTRYPDAKMTIHKRTITTTEEIRYESKTVTNVYKTEVPYFTDGKTCWVEVSVEICGKTYTEMLAIMDNKMNAVRLEAVTSTQVNKAIQRCFVKACARHGLGLYIFRGEDLPTAEKNSISDTIDRAAEAANAYVEVNEVDFTELQISVCEKFKTVLNSTMSPKIINATSQFIGESLPEGERLSTLIDTKNNKMILGRINEYLDVVTGD